MVIQYLDDHRERVVEGEETRSRVDLCIFGNSTCADRAEDVPGRQRNALHRNVLCETPNW